MLFFCGSQHREAGSLVCVCCSLLSMLQHTLKIAAGWQGAGGHGHYYLPTC